MNSILVGVALLVPSSQDPIQAEPIDQKIATMIAAIRAEELEKNNRALVGFHTRHVLSVTDDPKRGTGAARSYLQKAFEACVAASGGRLSVAREVVKMPSRRLGQNVELVNIVATLKGTTDPTRVYVVGGHYDSINGTDRGRDSEGQAPGANDDGSGTCVALEACRVMSKMSFPATIKFVAYDGEEQGLLGSEGHAKALAAAEVNVAGMITNDIVGNTLGMDGKRRRGYLRAFSYSANGNDSPGRSMARVAAYVAARHVKAFRIKLIYRGDRFGRGGDHKSFHKRGYASIRLTEPREDYSRQHANVTERDGKPYGDLPQFVDWNYVTKVTAVNVATLAHLASAPPPPERVRARGSRTSYDVLLSFTPVDGAHRYEAVWRQTTAPDWQGARLIEKPQAGRRGGLAYTLKGVCLDDCVVGIRSVAKDGSRSRVMTPPEPDSFNQRQVRRGR